MKVLMNRKTDCRQALLEAAERVVTEAGAAHLTLDAVAEKAGVSKGGLLYHFPSKEALVQGMIARLLELVDADEARFKAELGDVPGADLQAYVLAGFEQRPEQQTITTALLAAGANDPKLLEPVRAWSRRNYEAKVKSKRHPIRAAMVVMAIDGLWLHELLDTSPLCAKERHQLKDALLEIAKSAV